MTASHRFVCMQIIAFWPVWLWYGQRMLDRSDEPWGILALATVLFIVAQKRTGHIVSRRALIIATTLTLIYAVTFALLPPLLRAIVAVLAIAVTLSGIGYGRTLQAGVAGLLLLSLPLIASLQFYGGFPIRAITAFFSSGLLQLIDYDVQPQGTLLFWQGEVIAVDAPCAGIKMLWTALYLNFTLAAWRDLGLLATWLSTSVTMFSVFIGNVLRSTLLFFTESGIINAPDIAHSLIGIIVFALVASAVLGFHQCNGRATPCAV
ncbi:archaeosortase/exosortase family protein [Methylomarinum sp. Ch1-1]|uniref:Archaeosortase/exosortase family protein n=1 Tax=Methylomarinum roseum TaxID=3067653 RepID=A0AAU7NW47_9GAMM|nr:archaeosortase/exosortase family protein [Methylomarinum sp. Ch1-1]MDP4522717.1 archaeosortase/exosortase family protein [Methylomarinum sp. Ch1-1]